MTHFLDGRSLPSVEAERRDGNSVDPRFLGPAIYCGARPDVAAAYGDRFADSFISR